MGWSLVEEFVEARTADRVCEDLIVLTADHAAVIDGASDATGAQFGGWSGGRLAAETIRSTIQDLDPDATAREFIGLASAELLDVVGALPSTVRWPAATIVCLSFALPPTARDIVLASDGFPDPRPTLDESEARLRDLLQTDPAAIGDLSPAGKRLRPGANSVDDRAFLRLRCDAK